jgi:methionyl-tRNA formyltransferase
VRIVYMGTPDFAVPPLESLLLNKYEVVAVYTQPDKPTGRGQKLVASPVKQLAVEWNVPVERPTSLKQPEEIAKLAGWQPDIILVAAYGKILPQAVLDVPKYGCLNIHPSLLPRWRGATPIPAAILAGDAFTGVSIMQMAAGVDNGPVVAQVRVPVSGQDNTGLMTEKLSLVSARLIQDVLVRWVRGEFTPRPQDEALATYTQPLRKEEGEIDWQQPAAAIWRKVRAFNPRPGCFTWWQGKRLKILEVMPLPGTSEAGKVGAVKVEDITGFTKEAIGVGTGEGVLAVMKVQLEGKQAVSAAEFLRGQRQLVGAVLPSH